MNAMFRRSTFVFSLLPLAATGCSAAPGEPAASSSEDLSLPIFEGAVIVETNAAEANELLVYARAVDGTLRPSATVSTGGAGLGTGLSSQGALAREGRWLFAVNAGSDDVSTFDLSSGTPVLVDRTPSGGTQPVSVAARDGLVYVLNAGGENDVAGFRLDGRGGLHAIATLPLSAASVTPTDVGFSPDGDTLVVTEKDTGIIDTYSLDRRGVAHGPTLNTSDGPTPFGFSFAPDGELFVSEAAGSAASAYAIRGAHLRSISASVANGQAAACWLATSPDGLHAFTANAGNGTLSAYRVGFGGALTLESAIAASTGAGSHPIDMAFTPLGTYLYALANGNGTLIAYRVQGASLTPLATLDGLPHSSMGAVAY
jgi:6-phosphogluconolactonase (cycloisomerase 2 family)